jgi:hypothetical protein
MGRFTSNPRHANRLFHVRHSSRQIHHSQLHIPKLRFVLGDEI